MKRVLLLAILIFFLPLVSAEISLTSNLDEEYNLGDSIISTFSVSTLEERVFKTTLSCDETTLDYHTSWLKPETKSIEVVIPKLAESMIGDCVIIAKLLNLDNEIVEETESDSFEVTNELNLEVNLKETELMPGDPLEIDFKVNKQNINEIKVYLSSGSHDEQITLTQSESKHTINLDDLTSGQHYTFIQAEDSFGNTLETDFTFSIKQIPDKIELNLNQEVFNPSEQLIITPILKDKTNKEVKDAEIIIEISNKKSVLLSTTTKSSNNIIFSFEPHTLPGEYTIKTTYESIKTSKKILMQEVESISAQVEGQDLIIINTGNIDYNQVVPINFQNINNQVYVIDQKVKLTPGTTLTTDLSKFVPSGNYQISILDICNSNATINDNRPLYRKVLQDTCGVGVTGAAVTSLKPKSNFPFFILLALIPIILGVFILKKKDLLPEVKIDVAKTPEEKQDEEEDMKEKVAEMLKQKGIDSNQKKQEPKDNFSQIVENVKKQEEIQKQKQIKSDEEFQKEVEENQKIEQERKIKEKIEQDELEKQKLAEKLMEKEQIIAEAEKAKEEERIKAEELQKQLLKEKKAREEEHLEKEKIEQQKKAQEARIQQEKEQIEKLQKKLEEQNLAKEIIKNRILDEHQKTEEAEAEAARLEQEKKEIEKQNNEEISNQEQAPDNIEKELASLGGEEFPQSEELTESADSEDIKEFIDGAIKEENKEPQKQEVSDELGAKPQSEE